jgi:hypothetical protein
VGWRLIKLRYVDLYADCRIALGILEGESLFCRGGEAAISTAFLSLYFCFKSNIDSIYSEQIRPTRPDSSIAPPEISRYSLIAIATVTPSGILTATWSIPMAASTEMMLSSPELLMDVERVITV